MKCLISDRRDSSLTDYAFLGANLAFSVLGLCSIAVGLWLFISKSDYIYVLAHDFGAFSASALCIIIGIVVVSLGLVGCCGLRAQSRRLMIAYMASTVIVVTIEIAASALMLNYQKETTRHVERHLEQHFHSKGDGLNDRVLFAVNVTWNKLQTELKCCGVRFYSDWFRDSRRWPQNDWVPDSCCDLAKFDREVKNSFENCGKMGNPSLWYERGCYDVFNDWLFRHLTIAATINFAVALMQVFALVICVMVYLDDLKVRTDAEPLKRFSLVKQQETAA